MRPLADAQRQVLETVPGLPVVASPLATCLGLVLAENVVAHHDIPPFDNSAMDGYAVRAADVASPPTLECIRSASEALLVHPHQPPSPSSRCPPGTRSPADRLS